MTTTQIVSLDTNQISGLSSAGSGGFHELPVRSQIWIAIQAWRQDGKSVGVIAVDPSSKASGGALLGDRVRIVHDALDDGVFVRSVYFTDPNGIMLEFAATTRAFGPEDVRHAPATQAEDA